MAIAQKTLQLGMMSHDLIQNPDIGMTPQFLHHISCDLRLAGHITASDASLGVATQLFTGSEAWMPDNL